MTVKLLLAAKGTGHVGPSVSAPDLEDESAGVIRKKRTQSSETLHLSTLAEPIRP